VVEVGETLGEDLVFVIQVFAKMRVFAFLYLDCQYKIYV
jgi:hypothetical protein